MPPVDPFKYWDDFFAKQKFDNSASVEKLLLSTVLDFMRLKKFVVVEAVLTGYLHYYGKEAEPWMYIYLAESLKFQKKSDSTQRQYLSYAAFLAKRAGKSEDLIRIADLLILSKSYGKVGEGKYETNIGELLDLACEKAPTNAYPMMMSVNLATHDKDPKRMADAAEQLLSIGWPGFDDRVRRDLRQQVKNLAETLKLEDRQSEATALMDRLSESESRDIYARLTWKGEADIDMIVAEPFGATANYQNFRTVSGGAIIQNGYGKHPEEIYVVPRAFAGEYVITLEKIVDYDEAKPVLEATLEVILHEGAAEEKKETYKIDLAKPQPIIVKLPEGAGRRKKFLPFIAAPPPPPILIKPTKKANDKTSKDSTKKEAAPIK